MAEIELPPLRERREDIPMLFEHFVLRAAERYGRVAPLVASSQRAELIAYAWPGNVRELHNVAERFVLGLLADRFGLTHDAPAPMTSLADQIARVERTLIEDALRRHHGNVINTAEALCLPKNTLYDRMRRLGISGSGAVRENVSAASVPPALEH